MSATEMTLVVSAVSGTNVTVVMPDGSLQVLQRLRHVSCAAGDLVKVDRQSGSQVVVGAYGAGVAPPPPPPDPTTPPPPPPPSEKRTGTDPVAPAFSGTYRSGWRGDTADLYEGDYSGRGLNFGAAFYADGIQSLPGSLTAGRLKLVRAQAGTFGALAPTICLLAGKTRPGGIPTILATATGPALKTGTTQAAWGRADWSIPSGWLAQLDSGAAGGFGIWVNSRDPYIRLTVLLGGMTFIGDWKDTA